MIERHSVTKQALAFIAENMRQPDREELWASAGLQPAPALRISVAISDAFVWTDKGVPFAAAGVSGETSITGVGVPWLLGTDAIERWPRRVAFIARRQLRDWQQRFDRLENHTHVRNIAMIKLLEKLGFSIEDAKPWGRYGEYFHRFSWTKGEE